VNHARLIVGVALLLAASVGLAADPPAPNAKADKPAQTPAMQPARAPLNLRVGDIRKYMMPNEYRASVNATDADKAEIVVEGERAPPPLKSEQPLPGGLAAYYSLFRHPTTAWRLFLPDPRAPGAGRPNVVPEREVRLGP